MFKRVIQEWKIIEALSVPKVDRQSAMARRVGVNVNGPGDLNKARSKMRTMTGADRLAGKAVDAKTLQYKKDRGVPPIGGGQHPVGVAATPFHREKLRTRKKFGGKLF